jgi:hypothetical protein
MNKALSHEGFQTISGKGARLGQSGPGSGVAGRSRPWIKIWRGRGDYTLDVSPNHGVL